MVNSGGAGTLNDTGSTAMAAGATVTIPKSTAPTTTTTSVNAAGQTVTEKEYCVNCV